MNRSLSIAVLLVAWMVAPLFSVAAVRCVPIGTLTHHMNINGTWDRNLWLRVLGPTLYVGRAQERALGAFPLSFCP